MSFMQAYDKLPLNHQAFSSSRDKADEWAHHLHSKLEKLQEEGGPDIAIALERVRSEEMNKRWAWANEQMMSKQACKNDKFGNSNNIC